MITLFLNRSRPILLLETTEYPFRSKALGGDYFLQDSFYSRNLRRQIGREENPYEYHRAVRDYYKEEFGWEVKDLSAEEAEEVLKNEIGWPRIELEQIDVEPLLAGAETKGGPGFKDFLYAPLSKRLAAQCIDLFLALAFAAIVFILLEQFVDRNNLLLAAWFGLVFSLIYSATLMRASGSQNGQTLGKRCMRIRVVRENGQSVTAGYGSLRQMGFLLIFVVPSIALVFPVFADLLPVFGKKRRTLHDRFVESVVVRTDLRREG